MDANAGMLVLSFSMSASGGSCGPEQLTHLAAKGSGAAGPAHPWYHGAGAGGALPQGPLLLSVKEARRHLVVALGGEGSDNTQTPHAHTCTLFDPAELCPHLGVVGCLLELAPLSLLIY